MCKLETLKKSNKKSFQWFFPYTLLVWIEHNCRQSSRQPRKRWQRQPLRLTGRWEADWDRLHHVSFLQGVSRVDKPFPYSWRVYAATWQHQHRSVRFKHNNLGHRVKNNHRMCICSRVINQSGFAYYRRVRFATAAHTRVFGRVWRREPEPAAPHHLHLPECCCIQPFPPIEHSKPCNPPQRCVALYKPVKKPNVKFQS